MTIHKTLMLSAICVGFASFANAATLSSLIAGGSLVEGDVTFDNFAFEDFFTTSPFPVLAGDREVTASEIDMSTSSTASSVTLTATLNPAISIAGFDTVDGYNHKFEFFLDFSISIAGTSSREIIGAKLGGGDLFASGIAFSEVVYDTNGGNFSPDLEIFAAANSATTDSESFAGTTSAIFNGFARGETSEDGATAGLSTYSLTFDLQGTPPEPEVVPLPAGLPLLIGGLFMLGLASRWRNAA